jgi:predicted nucleotidyltransferase
MFDPIASNNRSEGRKKRMDRRLAQCSWPKLTPKYIRALREAVDFILQRYKVSGIIASGTIIRGNPDPASDLDIYVIHKDSYRQRIQKYFNSVPAEIFVNPPEAIESYFVEEHVSRKPLTAHMLATGYVILDLDPIVAELQKKAKAHLSKPPDAPKDLTMRRYGIALLYEDAVDIALKDPSTAQMILGWAVLDMLNYTFIQTGKFIPRHKNLLKELALFDPRTAEIAQHFYQEPKFETRLKLAGEIADRTIGERGFFEWDAPPEEFER